uniref:Uncharacterized protein n=1 Tax=Octopus bimaculoides TaxID=37653 RepID=A0A0L8IA06_OCTBM
MVKSSWQTTSYFLIHYLTRYKHNSVHFIFSYTRIFTTLTATQLMFKCRKKTSSLYAISFHHFMISSIINMPQFTIYLPRAVTTMQLMIRYSPATIHFPL